MTTTHPAALPTVDELAQAIRIIDGNNMMGAGVLAEELIVWMQIACAPLAAAPASEPALLFDERAEFEAWADSKGYEGHRDETDKYKDYHRATTRFAREGWLAALAWAKSRHDHHTPDRRRQMTRSEADKVLNAALEATKLTGRLVVLYMTGEGGQCRAFVDGVEFGRDGAPVVRIAQSRHPYPGRHP